MDLTVASFYADTYQAATRELGAHWPDPDGFCEECGQRYPCAEEWLIMRSITGIEAMWRRWAADVTQSAVAAIHKVG